VGRTISVTAQRHDDAAESSPGHTVEEEVDGMVDEHEQIADSLRYLHVCTRHGSRLLLAGRHLRSRVYGEFAAVGPSGRRYRSTAARPAVGSQQHCSSRTAEQSAAANAGNATLSAEVGS